MSEVPPSPNQDTHFAAWTAPWDSMLQMQQRWWAQWAEGLQLWTPWWLTPLPPLSPSEWQQGTEAAAETATEVGTEAAEAVSEQAGEVTPPVPLPTPNRPRGNQPRPH